MPNATVEESSTFTDSSWPASYAVTIGAQPVAWTHTSRGSSPSTQPSSRASTSALWMPIRPTPPPVG